MVIGILLVIYPSRRAEAPSASRGAIDEAGLVHNVRLDCASHTCGSAQREYTYGRGVNSTGGMGIGVKVGVIVGVGVAIEGIHPL